MSDHLRALVALLAVTLLALVVLHWMLRGSPMFEGFVRRRKWWVGALLLTFAIPHFYIGMLVLGAYYVWATRKDPNPVAFYLMFLLAVPPIQRPIEGFGPISMLFELNNMRLLGLVVLAPLAFRLFTAPKPKGPPPSLAPRFVDIAAILLTIYMILIYVPQESITMLMRRTVHEILDFTLPYFVISRYCRDRERIVDALGGLLVGAFIVSMVAIFEHFKGWLLYTTMPERWGVPDLFLSLYVLRDSALRASASSGHPLVLGHLLVVCVGIFGFFRNQLASRSRVWLAWAILLLGLYSTVSRGPWVAAALVLVMMGLFTKKVFRFYAVLAASSVAVTGALLVSPWADKVINFLPFIGKVDQGNVEYRQQILDTALIMIRQNPVFGNVRVLDQLEHLRQGQGIIDIVNVYAEVAMTYGLLGLFFFCLFLFSTVLYSTAAALRMRKRDVQLFELIGCTTAALVGSLVTLAGIANYLSVPLVYTSVAALLVAAVRVSRRPLPQKTEPVVMREPGRALAVRA